MSGAMRETDKVNILLVDDQPGKLLSYEAVLRDVGERLIKASSGREALEQLLKNDIAVILVDVCMPDLDGFQLAAMIREHPRFRHIAIIFISAILLGEMDHLRGYEMGAVDYVPVPVVPEVLRAKVKVFVDLYRKTRQLEELNRELEQRVSERTRELEQSNARLRESEHRRSLALAAGRMGSWDWDLVEHRCVWDEGQCRIFGVDTATFVPTVDTVRPLLHPDDWVRVEQAFAASSREHGTFQTELRVVRPSGETRWCIATATGSFDPRGTLVRLSGVTIDITDRKEAEEHQLLLAREVDHRARNALAVVHAIVRLSRASTMEGYVEAVEGRIRALAQTHALLSQSRWQGADLAHLVEEEMTPFRIGQGVKVTAEGASLVLPAEKAQIVALALHELATNAAKYGALSCSTGRVDVRWRTEAGRLVLVWKEIGGPKVELPVRRGFGSKIMNASLKQQVGGDVVFDWHPGGLVCTLWVPFADPQTKMDGAEPSRDNLVPLKPGVSGRIMLVEDEVLLGMLMRDMITEMGYFVAGPYCTVSEAMAASEGQEFDAAVLDVNLGGEHVYPLADRLTAKGVPCIFVTGYDEEGIDDRFSQLPILQKPVNRKGLEPVLRACVKPTFGGGRSDVENEAATEGTLVFQGATEPKQSVERGR
jgi:PAS domain S-box-containing protein